MTVYQWIALASAGTAIAGGAWNAVRMRRERRLSILGLALAAGGPAISLWFYLVLSQVQLRLTASVAFLAVGALLGVIAARNVGTLTTRGGTVLIVGASWLPLPAVAALGGVQVAAAFGSFSWFVVALAALEAAVAFGVGASLTLVARRFGFGVGTEPRRNSPEGAR